MNPMGTQLGGLGVDIDAVKRAAVSEVISPTWALTEQYLRVNKVVSQNGELVIADMTFPVEDVAVVWFPIDGESYYLLIGVECKPLPALRFIRMSAGNRVSLVVISDNVSLDDLVTALPGIEFTETWRKGDVRRKTPHGDILWKYSGFEIEPYAKTSGDVEDKLETVLALLKNKRDHMKELSKLADDVEISISYFGYKDDMSGIHLAPDIVRELAELGVSIDIDLYASGPDLSEVPE